MSKQVEQEVDVAVIGAGTAGLTAFREARKHTERVVLIDGGPDGTTCARTGCMPSKLLIAAAEAAHAVQRAPAFGIEIDGASVLGAAVMARVRRERDRFVRLVQEGVESISDSRRLRENVYFRDAHTLVSHSGEQVVRFRSAVIATGSSPRIPDMFAHLHKRLITSADIFDWQDLPESLQSHVFGLQRDQ